VYEDPYSPFCVIAGSNGEADLIHTRMNQFCTKFSQLTVVRNDVYARFSHNAYNKGTALAEISRGLGVRPTEIFAAGDHLNDLPMLKSEFANFLAAPTNAVAEVKEVVARQQGFVSGLHCGNGVAEGLEHYLRVGK
jgi:hydroxymethylpyrimidine pyrophosphatase-like HAD family hydrolase